MFNFLFDAVIAATMSTHPSANVRMLYSLEGPRVGSKRKMREVSFSYLEFTDDMVLVSDSMDTLEEALRVLNRLCVGWT